LHDLYEKALRSMMTVGLCGDRDDLSLCGEGDDLSLCGDGDDC